MRDGARWSVALAAIVAAFGVTGCEPPPGSVNTPSVFLQGDWRACQNDGTADVTRTMRFYSDSYGLSTQTFPTTNTSCAGTATSSTYQPWRYTLGSEVAATVGPGGTPVAARTINIMNSFTTTYSIVWVDQASSPARMYFGDLAADPALDGTAPEKRPTVLSVATSLSAL
jgi:hypothetical protein